MVTLHKCFGVNNAMFKTDGPILDENGTCFQRVSGSNVSGD